MRVFIVQYSSRPGSNFKVSQEGFCSLEEAQRFIEGRANNPQKQTEWYYQTPLFEEYCITEVWIRNKRSDDE